MNTMTSFFTGHRMAGVLTVVFVAACSAALRGGEKDSGFAKGAVKVRAGTLAGSEIPVAPPVRAVRIETALHNEGILLPAGGAAAAGTCNRDLDCDDCNTCTVDTCDFTPGTFDGVCDNAARDLCEICGNDNFCDGVEICDAGGLCQSATAAPCTTDPTKICDENAARAGDEACVAPCGSGGVTNIDDGIACNGTEVCQPQECVGGDNPGNSCQTDAECPSGFCGGIVVRVDPPCGSTIDCTEGPPVTCSLNGRCCTPDAGEPTGFACSRSPKNACTGVWLGVGDIRGQPGDEALCDVLAPASASNAGEGFMCPAYGSGIAPVGAFPEVLGQIGAAPCAPLGSLGDDYAIPDSGPGGANENKFVRLNTIRWVGGFQEINIQANPSRYRVVIFDPSGNRIEDVITDPVGQGDIARRTVVFEEQPFIPPRGFVVIEPAPRFSPFARVSWATTDAVDVGDNDPDTLWVNGGPQDAQIAFPGTTGRLAFEVVGDIVNEPLGACCDGATGACSLTLPWLCNGSFQGAGVECQVCANNPFTACIDDNDCPTCANSGDPCDPNVECPGGACSGGVCDAGDNIGQVCDVDFDCNQGGDPTDTCSATATCVPVPPACSLSACCTDGTQAVSFCIGGERDGRACSVTADCLPGGDCTGATTLAGECVAVEGGFCSEDGTTPCVDDGDCTGTCEAPCPAGSNSAGFGSSCDPQLCQQTLTGFDTCVDAALPGNLVVIPVPDVGAPPVTVTFSGDNSNATFNDHQDDVGEANATCNFGLLSSAGGTKDRGWWHAFSIDDCAVVRVDFCGTFELYGDIRQPQWAFIAAECDPCGVTLGASIVGAPVGEDDASGNRGLPFCTGGDDLWETYGPLNAGVYWQPVFTAPTGYIGPYQMHITVGACPVAACCLPGSYCVDPGTQFLLTDGSGNPFPCDTVACADQPGAESGSCEACALANEPVCDAIGGFWNALQNLPSGSPAFIVDCGFGGDGPCDIGSCCQGAGNCRDTAGDPADCDPTDPSDPDCCNPAVPGTCMTRAICENEPPPASFVGGAQCDFPTPPCPACNILGANNCQLPVPASFGSGSGIISDLTIPPNGQVAADDFIPLGSTLSSVCVWGFYHDATLEGDEEFDCIGAVVDEFRVRVYADNNGLPGTLLGESMVTGARISRGKEPNTGFEAGYNPGATNALPQGFTLILDNPITTLNSGAVHWLEVANNTTGSTDAAKKCWWNWLTHFPSDAAPGLGYSVAGANSGGTDNPAEYLVGASRYISGSTRPYDLAFCTGTGAAGDIPLGHDPIETPKAACWTCPDAGTPVCTVETLLDCSDTSGIQGIWNRADPDCSGTFADIEDQVAESCTGAVASSAASLLAACGDGFLDPGEQCDPPGATCDANCQLICPTAPPPGTCSGGTNAGEPCFDLTDCPDQGPGTACDLPEGGAVLITAGLHSLNTNCSGTDGATNIPTVEGNANVGHDSWFHYETTCTGFLHVNACPTGPGDTASGFSSIDNLLSLYFDPSDQSGFLCPGASTAFQSNLGSDEGCNGMGDAGPGILSRIVLPGEKWTIRNSGWGAAVTSTASGPMLLDVDCIASACFVSQPPSVHQIPDFGGTPRDNKKGRYLPVVVNDVGRSAAIQVEFVSLPAPYDLWNGAVMFAQAPRTICETSTVTASPPAPCTASTYATARLECASTPNYTDWNALGVVNLWHEGIVAGGTYDVRVIDESCNPGVSANFSAPTTMQTARFGDTVSASGPQFPADDSVDVPDAIAGLLAFSNAVTKPSKSRTELEFACIDDVANVGDVLMSLRGFSGLKHPAVPSSGDPCANQCVNTRP